MQARRYRTALMQADMDALGLKQADVLTRSRGRLSPSRLSKFLSGVSQSQRTAQEIALSLGYPLDRYLAARTREHRELAEAESR